MLDFVIQNATLLDPNNGPPVLGDIGIQDGLIAAVGQVEGEARERIDATGCYLTPALVDYHAHVFVGGTEVGVPADLIAPPSGAAGVVDGGSSGCANFEAFHRTVMTHSAVDVRAMLNICSVGQPEHNYPEDQNPALVNRDRIAGLCRDYPRHIVAIKLRQSRNIVKEWGLEPLRTARAVAERVGLPLVVHASDSPGDIAETLDLLRPGDVFCHVYHQLGQTILDDRGRVRRELFAARKRGVLFDMARGRSQFSGLVARAALEQGFPPDIVSSDATVMTHGRPPGYSLVHIMAEMCNLGMAFPEVVRACSAAPAGRTGRDGRPFLAAGEPASLAVFRIVDREMRYRDFYGNEYGGTTIIRTELTLRDGAVLYRHYGNHSVLV